MSQVAGVNIVSKVQLYVDLFNYLARGEEAADPRGLIYLENGKVKIERMSPIQLGEVKRGGDLRF